MVVINFFVDYGSAGSDFLLLVQFTCGTSMVEEEHLC